MRFFAHDGSTVHGPSGVAELLNLPGFDGDTLVCPVGSENSADWKPALAYPPFREALLAPRPAPAPAPAPPPPAPPPPPPTSPCPRCGHPNPEFARYCNACAARMDGTIEAPPAPAPAPTPAPAPVAPPEPVFVPAPDPVQPALVLPDESPVAAAPAAPAAAAPVAAERAALRNTLIAAFVGASLASGALGYWLLRPKTASVPASGEITLTPPPAPVAPPPAVPAATVAVAPAPAASPVAPVAPPPAPVAPKKIRRAPAAAPEVAAAPKPKTPRKSKAKRRKAAPVPPLIEEAVAKAADDGNGAGESLIESHGAPNAAPAAAAKPGAADAPQDPDDAKILDQLTEPGAAKPAEAAAPAAKPAEAEQGFILPGVPRRAATKAATPQIKIGAETSPVPDAPAAAAPAAAAAAAKDDGKDASKEPEDGTSRQVREQFEFCSQLLAQGAFSDHFDTCLCSESRQASPYRGRRGFYASALKKLAAAGTLETEAQVVSVVLDGAVAKVTAKWKSGPKDRARQVTERWRLEEGLWCREP